MMRRMMLSLALVTIFLISLTLSETQNSQVQVQSQDDALQEVLKTRVMREAGAEGKKKEEKKKKKRALKKEKQKKKGKIIASSKGRGKKKALKKKKNNNDNNKVKNSKKIKNKKKINKKIKNNNKKKINKKIKNNNKKNIKNKKKINKKKNNNNKKKINKKKKNSNKKKIKKKNGMNKNNKIKNGLNKNNKKKKALNEKKKKKKKANEKRKSKKRAKNMKRKHKKSKKSKTKLDKKEKIKARNERAKKIKKLRKLGNRQNNSTAQCKQSDEVSTNCLQNAADAMTFLEKQATNFLNQWRRIQSFNKTINGKLGKNGAFANVTGYLLTALGGDSSNVSCGETGSRDAASSAKALQTYNTLKNCSKSITAACTMPASIVPADVISKFTGFCMTKFNEAKTASDDCRTNKQYTSNGTAACECWSKVGAVINTIKSSSDCSASTYSKAVKQFKNACVQTFMTCRKEEDASVQLVYTCGSGEVLSTASSSSSSGRLASHMSIMAHSSLQ